jgi:hypothetical protein
MGRPVQLQVSRYQLKPRIVTLVDWTSSMKTLRSNSQHSSPSHIYPAPESRLNFHSVFGFSFPLEPADMQAHRL